MTWPEERKLVELGQKLSSIESEFTYWLDQTGRNGPMPKHHSQVRRVTNQLSALAQSLATWLGELKSDQERLLRETRQVEPMILDVHRIWEFFRSKLAQRYVDLFRGYLAVADEFAWACYDCARTAADPLVIPPERVKEPPLVFLNGGWSPFAMSRGMQFEAEWVPDEEISLQHFRQVLQDLPIPVIGLPWYQIRHLPDMVAIGHEVGHTVEDDFGLTPRLGCLLDKALESGSVSGARHEGWRAWLGELFGDLYGILASGPAFVSGLMDFMALSPAQIMTERQPDPTWSCHPPDALRMIFNFRALELTGFEAQAADLRSMWTERFPRHAMTEFHDDIDPIVVSLRDGPYPEFHGTTLTEVISFGPTEAVQANSVKDALLCGLSPVAPIRPIVAGARLAFEEDPAGFTESEADQIVVATVRGTQTTAFRSEEEAVRLDALDATAGQALFEKMRRLRSDPHARPPHRASIEVRYRTGSSDLWHARTRAEHLTRASILGDRAELGNTIRAVDLVLCQNSFIGAELVFRAR
jgi:hypothetical protein